MKNIYSQLVVTFIIVVAASFLITLLMSDWVFQRQQMNFVQDRILRDAEAMAEIQASIPEDMMQKYLNSQGGQTQLVVIGEDGTEYRSEGNGPGGPLGISPPPLPLGNDSSSSSDSSGSGSSSGSSSSSSSSDDSSSTAKNGSSSKNGSSTDNNSGTDNRSNTDSHSSTDNRSGAGNDSSASNRSNNEDRSGHHTTSSNSDEDKTSATTNESSSTSSSNNNTDDSNGNSKRSTTSQSTSNMTGEEATGTTSTTGSDTSSSTSSKPSPPVPPHLQNGATSSSSDKKKPPTPPRPPKDADRWDIPEAVQQLVLSGRTYHPQKGNQLTDPNMPSLNLSLDSNEQNEPRYVGVPFERDGVHYALFARPAAGHFVNQFNQWMFLVLSVMLIIGVLLFLFAARLIARPIAKLSDATRRVAKGDYDVRVHLKRRDEIGQLGENFNQMTTRLSKIEAMRQEFVSNVSHEIQTPLTSIRGFAVALKDTASSEQLKHLKIIEQESERLSKLSSNLLKLASLDVVKLNKQNFRLDEQIRMAVVSCGPMWMNKHIELSADLNKIEVAGDEDLLTQVWTNLLSNAIKFTPEHGNIYITLTEDEHWIKASVQDTGCGIDAEHVEHIFERFYKADSSRNSAVGGNGLGLSIVQKILLLHGGRIEAHSAEGQGTTMTVYLPRTAAAASVPVKMTKKAASQ
ncbi:sensor histidine kinase [Paenibacillus wenxiniae]|uniref:Heme sensor protein HssS n=1 Tax=Paenibacillus wenxiniae TaxID=1636843 RepID=A0ABW4RD60_9BACL